MRTCSWLAVESCHSTGRLTMRKWRPTSATSPSLLTTERYQTSSSQRIGKVGQKNGLSHVRGGFNSGVVWIAEALRRQSAPSLPETNPAPRQTPSLLRRFMTSMTPRKYADSDMIGTRHVRSRLTNDRVDHGSKACQLARVGCHATWSRLDKLQYKVPRALYVDPKPILSTWNSR